MKKLAALCFSSALLAATTSLTAASDYTFIKIADDDDVFGLIFATPSINDAGQVAFIAAPGGSERVYIGDGGPLTEVATVSVSSISGINENGRVAVSQGVLFQDQTISLGDGGPLELVVENDGNPFGILGFAQLNSSDDLAFFAQVNGVAGVHLASGFGNYTTIADETGSFDGFGFPLIADDGSVAFFAQGSGQRGIYRWDGGGPLVPILTETLSVDMSIGSIGSGGNVAYVRGTAFEQGIYIGNGITTTTIADISGPFTAFSGIAMNDVGDYVFEGRPDGSFVNGYYDGPDPTTDCVFAPGDPLFGSTLIGYTSVLGPNIINNHGEIAFIYILENGERGIAVAVPSGAPVPGDLNGDGFVDTTDLVSLLASWGPCPPPCPPTCNGDINGDCTVGVSDLISLLSNWS